MEPAIIKDVIIAPLNIPLEEPFTIAIGTKFNIENVLVTILLDNGVEGLGEAAPLEPLNGENQATAIATIASCKEFLIGRDVSDYRQVSKYLKNVFRVQATARCAIEMAMIDAFTKCLNIPLYKFFGGAEDILETDYTIDIVDPATAKSNAGKLSRAGYNILKTKVGKNMKDDIDRILAIREGAPGCRLMLDANQGYTPCQAVHFLEELEKRNISPELFEQPVVKHDLKGMRFVKDHTSVPVAADESVFTSADAIEIVRTGCADLINIKLMKSGIVEALDIAAIARSANIGLMTGCMLETRLGLGASVHLAAGLGGFSFIDLDPHLNPEKDPFEGGPLFKDPVYTLSDVKAGIGVYKKS
jgi:L-Ala-D/L-Glu epimerase